MKIQNLPDINFNRRTKLLRASMLYIVLFAIGAVFFVNATNGGLGGDILNRIVGNYKAPGGAAEMGLTPEEVKSELDKFATLKTPDNANLPSCESYTVQTNYDDKTKLDPSVIYAHNDSSNKDCKSGSASQNEECRAVTKDGQLAGWLRLQLCENRSNPNFGCTPGKYTAGDVHTASVLDFPMLEFLSSTQPAQSPSTTAEDTTSKSKVAGLSSTPYKYTQPPAFYSIFRNVSSPVHDQDVLSYGTLYDGPIFFSGPFCSAVVPYERLGTAIAAWGNDDNNFQDDKIVDVKQFYKQYWDPSLNTPQASQPDSFWNQILSWLQSVFSGGTLATDPDLRTVKQDLGDKDIVCKDLPGGGIELFNNSVPIKSDKIYEVTRTIYELSKKETCNKQYLSSESDAEVRGITTCTVEKGGDTFDFKYSELPSKIAKKEFVNGIPICHSKTICGTEYSCDHNASYKEAYKSCLSDGYDVSSIGSSDPMGIQYRVEKKPFDTLNLPNGNKLLKYTAAMEQLYSHTEIKYGENIGIKIKVQLAMQDIEWCNGPCTYGKDLKYKPDTISFDAKADLKTAFKNNISLSDSTPFNVPYPAGNPLFPADTFTRPTETKKNASQTELYYFFPQFGKLGKMLEVVSILITNQANSDSMRDLVKWFDTQATAPVENNPNVGKVSLKPCEDTVDNPLTPQREDRYDCFLRNPPKKVTPTPGLTTSPIPGKGYLCILKQAAASLTSQGLPMNPAVLYSVAFQESGQTCAADSYCGGGTIQYKDNDGTSACRCEDKAVANQMAGNVANFATAVGHMQIVDGTFNEMMTPGMGIYVKPEAVVCMNSMGISNGNPNRGRLGDAVCLGGALLYKKLVAFGDPLPRSPSDWNNTSILNQALYRYYGNCSDNYCSLIQGYYNYAKTIDFENLNCSAGTGSPVPTN